MTRIESKQNPALRHLARLMREKKYRQRTGEMACEGGKLLEEALLSGVQVKTVLLCTGAPLDTRAASAVQRAAEQGARLLQAEPPLFHTVSTLETPQSLLFSCLPVARGTLPDRLGSALLLDGVQDPGNLGTILRTADAFGLEAVVLCEGCADETAPKVVRATMGASFRQPVYHMPLAGAIAAMRARQLPVYAAALEPESVPVGAVPLTHTAVIVGNEGHGVTQQALEGCDGKLIIPMAGRAESLNAGVAASILIWEMTKGGKA